MGGGAPSFVLLDAKERVMPLRKPKAAQPVVCLDAKSFRVVVPCPGGGPQVVGGHHSSVDSRS